MWSVLILGLGCGARTNEVAPTAPTAPIVADSPAAEAPSADARSQMIRRLSSRDAGPSCADLDAMSADPVGDLLAIVATVSMPPTVPMRAADCLVLSHAVAAEATLAGWVVNPDTKGLAMLVTDRIDAIPPETALRLAKGAMAGPHAETVRAALTKSQIPGVPELAGGAK